MTKTKTKVRFQSTPSVWRETGAGVLLRTLDAISIHSLRVEGDHDAEREVLVCDISIHSLRVEGDFVGSRVPGKTHYFNPLPPCGGRRH